MTFISTETKKERDEKVSEGQKRSGRERNPEKLVTVYTACKLQHCQASANELSATLHSEGISKAVSLFRKPTLDNSKKKKNALNVDQEKQTRHHFSFLGTFP